MTTKNFTKITNNMLGAAIEVHKQMGPGLFEGIYEECLMYELAHRGIHAVQQVPVDLFYRGEQLKSKYMIDILVEDEIILELKAVKELAPVHTSQILSYLRLADKEIGYLINFHETTLMRGVRRYVNTSE